MSRRREREIVKHSFAVGEDKPLTIVAREFYSAEKIIVEAGQQYSFFVADGEVWTDWWKTKSIKGYSNPLANLIGMRVNDVDCFVLCAAYNDNDRGAFALNVKDPLTIIPVDAKTLSFFANDSKGFYWNNRGEIKMRVKRLK